MTERRRGSVGARGVGGRGRGGGRKGKREYPFDWDDPWWNEWTEWNPMNRVESRDGE